MTTKQTKPVRPIRWCRLDNGFVGELDDALTRFLGSLPDLDAHVGIDLSAIEFIEPTSLIVILAIFNDRKCKNQPTTIQFPRELAARRILRHWKFLDALKALGYLSIPDANFRDAPPNIGLHPSDNLQHAIEKDYLPIRIVCGSNDDDLPDIQHVDNELARCNETLMMAWLQSHLKGPEGTEKSEWRNVAKEDFPSRIVFEAIMNAVRHPNAKKIVTTSHIQWASKMSPKGMFTAVWWDDGKGIVETLRAVFEGDGQIISDAPSLPEKKCAITFKNGEQSDTDLTTNFVPNRESTDAELLFSSMCSRVTRDPKGIGHRSKLPDDVPPDSPLRQPGMGLYILVDCAIKIFGGSVSFRTGPLFMNVKRGKKRNPRKADYAVSISHPADYFPFPGNMLTVRLPIMRHLDGLGPVSE